MIFNTDYLENRRFTICSTKLRGTRPLIGRVPKRKTAFYTFKEKKATKSKVKKVLTVKDGHEMHCDGQTKSVMLFCAGCMF